MPSPHISSPSEFLKSLICLPLLTILFFLGDFHLCAAQEQQADTLTGVMEELEVKATHSALNTESAPFSVLTDFRSNEELNRTPAITLDKIAGHLPGIWVNDRENFALGERITIRGMGWRAAFGVRGIQVIMDGIPLTVADGQSVLNVVDPMFINRIELIRGPASAFWGNSSGGVLYLSTEGEYPSRPRITVRSVAGSYSTRKLDVQYSQSTDNHNVKAYSSYLYQAGYRDHSEAKIGRFGITGNLNLDSDNRLRYFGAFVTMPTSEHPSSLTKQQALSDPTQANASFEQIGAGKEVLQGQVGFSYLSSNRIGDLNTTIYGIIRDLSNPLPFGIIDLDRKAGGLRSTLQTRISDLKLNVGVSSSLQHDQRMEFDNYGGSRGAVQVDQLEKVFNNAVFLTATYPAGPLQVVGGLRYDWLCFTTDEEASNFRGERTFQAFNPSFGIHYSTGNTEFYTNISSGFEAPTTTELVNRPGGGNGFNPDLFQEKILGVELGSRGFISPLSLSYDIALYRYWINELIMPFQLTADGPTFFRNTGETRHWGAEANLTFALSPTFEATLTYSGIRALFQQGETLDGTSLNDNRIPGIPQHRAAGAVHWKPKSWWVTIDGQYVDRYPVNNENTAFNDSYFVANARLSYQSFDIGQNTGLTPFLAVNNLTDTRYNGSVFVNAFGGRYYEPAAGINWQAGFTIQFDTP